MNGQITCAHVAVGYLCLKVTSTDFSECRFVRSFTLRSQAVVNTAPRNDLDTESNMLLYETAKYTMSAFCENLLKTNVVYISLKKITCIVLFTKTILEIKEMKSSCLFFLLL